VIGRFYNINYYIVNVKEDKGNVLSFEDIRGAHFIFFKEREIWQS